MKINKDGITLLSLIITIVIMLILAGVSVSFLLGDNGLINKSKSSVKAYDMASIKERVETIIAGYEFDKTGDEGKALIDYLNEVKDEEKITSIKQVDEDYIDIVLDGYVVRIDVNTLKIVFIKEVGKDTTNMIGKYVIKTYNVETGKLTLAVTLTCNNNIDKVTCPDNTVKNNLNTKEVTFDYDVEDGESVNFIANVQNDDYIFNVQTKGFTKKDSIDIANIGDLTEFRDLVNAGYSFQSKNVNLVNDLDLASVCYKVDGTVANDVSWTPIGNSTNKFFGIFNGNNKTIKNLYINQNQNYLGLFGYTGSDCKISDLKLENVYSKGVTAIGGLVGQGEGDTIDHVIVSGNIIATTSYAGGISGFSEIKIINCGNNAVVQGGNYIGGIAGANKKDTFHSYNKANISGTSFIGGIVANPVGDINTCYNRGNISGIEAIGGIAGSAYSSIYYCYNTGSVKVSYTSSKNYATAGIVGYQGAATRSQIYGCFNLGTIYGNGNVGGLAGESRGSITYGYNNASVTSSNASNNYVGPIAGYQGGSMSKVQYSGTFPSVYSIVNLNNVNVGIWVEDTTHINDGYPLLSFEVNN